MAHDPVQIAVLKLQHLMQPMNELDVRIAAQFAEHGRAFNRLVQQRIEFAEQRDSTDFAHGSRSLPEMLAIPYCAGLRGVISNGR